MRIVTLLENDSIRNDLKSAHGLSLYIEHNHRKILFDIGPGNQYIKNAKKLGVDIKDVDYLIISHGHRDHGRGISKFLRKNKKAKVYIQETAFQKLYKNFKKIYLPIGIRKPVFSRRLVMVNDDIKIDNGIKIYHNVKAVDQIIKDDTLLKKDPIDGFVQDDFDHEIYLVLYGGKSKVLFSGCSHKGIENIIDSIELKEKKPFSAVVAGFHFSHYDSSNLRQTMYLDDFSEKMTTKGKVTYYTGHCTGDEAYLDLKQRMKDSLQRIKTGTEINL